MAISFTTTCNDGILYITAKGFDETLEDSKLFSLGVLQAAHDSKATKILSNELELEYRLGTIDLYVLTEVISKNAPFIKKAALVCDERYKQDMFYFERLSQNRGLCGKIFFNMDEAESWIKSDE